MNFNFKRNLLMFSKLNYNEIFIHKFVKISFNNFSTTVSSIKDEDKKPKKTTKYKHTILFPSTPFPQSLVGKKRIKNESKIQEISNFSSLYDIQEMRNTTEYILHDGPPYANGRLHMGHALNKILKDVTIRYKHLKGHKVNFVPGWDCHGLPIELKALERAQQKKETSGDWDNFTPLEIRNRAKKLAKETMEIQRRTYDEWGLFLNWNKRYCTNDPAYIAKQLRLFGQLYEKGFIFQAYMPVHFSPSSGTSLAESELEYNESHKSPSLYLGLPVMEEGKKRLIGLDERLPVYLSVWTTSPWTLPANMAVCIAEEKEYSLVETLVGGRKVALLWVTDRTQDLPSILQAPFKVLSCMPGKALKELEYVHPLTGGTCRVIPGDHVSTAKGTGLVHTAPAHGKDDFLAALKNGINTNIQLVDEKGRYKATAGAALSGKAVLEEGNDAVIELLQSGTESETCPLILHLSTVVHSYPYDWRTKKPTIVRASKQWFFDISKVKEKALKRLESVRIYPEKLRKRFLDLLSSRPYWCISRQRVWGVPIPVFYEQQTAKPLISSEFIDHVATLVEKEGGDVWWKYDEAKLLPPHYVEAAKQKGQPLPIKGSDIMDIWFDSGCSWYCAMDGKKADLCLEGQDQTNGWFQSSLLIAVAATGEAPFKTLFLHGFTVDEHYQKMSKSLKNVFDPQLITNGGGGGKKSDKKFTAFGASVLRWWALNATPVNDVPFGLEVVQSCENDVKAIRNAFAFFLGILNNFNPEARLSLSQLRIDERHVLSLIKPYLEKVWTHFENFEYNLITPLIYEFIVDEVGNGYGNSAKDVLYFEREDARKRRSIQTTIYLILPYLWQSMAPVIPHLAEEVALSYNQIKGDSVSCDESGVLPPPEWNQFENRDLYLNIIQIQNSLKLKFYEQKVVGADSIKYMINLKVGEHFHHTLKTLEALNEDFLSDLCAVFKVSQVKIDFDQQMADQYSLEISEAEGSMCFRCRRLSTYDGELCSRCKNVINAV